MEPDRDTATLLVLDLPTSALCGVDLISFKTSPRFRGIKHIPRGWHFVFTGISEAVSIRHGSWFHVSASSDAPPELLVKQYDVGSEVLTVVADENLVLKWRANLGSIWREGLTPYRSSVAEATPQSEDGYVEESQDWGRLTDCISSQLLSRVTGCDNQNGDWSLTSASCAKEDADHIPGLASEESTLNQEKDLGFLPIDLKQTWRSGAIGRERTEAAQDRSWALRTLIDEECNDPLEIIGELQFVFIMVLTLNNNSCLEQWKRILGLLLTCKIAAVDQPEFFARFLATLRLQLEHCQDAEGGLFDLSEDGAPLLKSLLKRFRKGLEQQSGRAKSDVMDELEDLEDFLKLEFGWMMNEPHVRSGLLRLEDGEEIDMDLSGIDEEDESGDYAPTIVSLTKEEARALHVNSDPIPARRRGESNLAREVASSIANDEEEEEEEGEEEEEEEEEERKEEEEEEQELEDMDARY